MSKFILTNISMVALVVFLTIAALEYENAICGIGAAIAFFNVQVKSD